MHDARLSRSLAQVAAVRRIFTRGKDRQRPEQSRALVTKWIDQYRVADPAPDAAGNGPVLRPPDDARGWWTIDAREAGAPARTLFYLHGGGFVYYSARTFVPLLAEWARAHRARVFVFEYPKAPEHAVDAIFGHVRDAVARARHLIDSEGEGGAAPSIAGDSVGGLLALYLATHALAGRFRHATLIYPVLSLHADWPSYDAFGTGFFLDADDMRWFASLFVPAAASAGFDPFALSGDALPPCRLHVAGCDVLRDEALAWTSRMRARGASIDLVDHEGMGHDFCLYAGKLPCARQAADRIGNALFS